MNNKEELEVINFTNITDKEWTGMWAQDKYVFQAGQTKAFPRFMAEHFAKHLADRVLIDEGKDFAADSTERKEVVERILGKVAIPAEEVHTDTPAQEPVFEGVPVEPSAEVPAETKKRGKKTVA
jgi:hypothetical protein